MKAYEIFQSETAEDPPEGLPLMSTRDNRGLTKFLRRLGHSKLNTV